MRYRRRVVDELLDDLFPHLAAIALEGAKGVGKTATAMQRAKTTISLDLPAQREILAADLDYVTQVEPPVLIDEWQLVPSVWDRVRRAVDDDARGGRFLLAGSPTPRKRTRIGTRTTCAAASSSARVGAGGGAGVCMAGSSSPTTAGRGSAPARVARRAGAPPRLRTHRRHLPPLHPARPGRRHGAGGRRPAGSA